MDKEVLRGRQLLLTISWVTIGISVLSILTYILGIGFDKLPQQIVRLLLTMWLFYLAYRGKRWAKGMMGIFASMGFVMGILNAIATLELTVIGAIYPGILALVYGVFGGILLTSPSIKAFQDFQRDRI